MNFRLAVVCEDASIESDGKMNLVRIFRQLRCESFPYLHPKMWLACSFEIPEAHYLDRSHIWTEFINPDGKKLGRVMNDYRILTGFSEDPRVFNFTAELRNLIFEEPGEYQFSIFADGTLVQAVDLRVRPLQ